MDNFPHHRIVVIGTTSSGKSPLAAQLVKKINAVFIGLDALHWEPNWVEAPDDVFRERVQSATSLKNWVVACNYHVVRDIVWPKAQATTGWIIPSQSYSDVFSFA